MASDFPGAFAALREIMRKHAGGLIVQSDTPTNFELVTPATLPNGKPLWFGAVVMKKTAVTYYLVPMYDPTIEARLSPQLRKRKHGKTCFNFQRPDPALFAELDQVTEAAREHWQRTGFFARGSLTREQLTAAAGGAC